MTAELGQPGTRPGRGEGPGYAARPLPLPPTAVRGAECGPEQRCSARPPSMRILGVEKGAGEANGDSVRIPVCSGPASC